MRGALAITAAFVVVGCSIGALEGFSGGGGDADASPGDGATIADVTTSRDANGNDAGDDAAVDAPVDSASGLDCDAGAFLLCSTFDQGTVADGWKSTLLQGGGTLGSSLDHRSAPYSLRAQLPAMADDANQYAALTALWTGVRGLRISLDLKIATPQWGSTTEAVALLHVLYPSTANETYLFRAPNETTLSIEQNAIASRYQVVQNLPYDQWLRVVLEVVPTTPTGTLRLRYDGLVIYENTSVAFAAASAPQTYVDLGLARFSAPSPAIDVLYDNVTIEQIP